MKGPASSFGSCGLLSYTGMRAAYMHALSVFTYMYTYMYVMLLMATGQAKTSLVSYDM